jgi:SAM-dependent methyltransferase
MTRTEGACIVCGGTLNNLAPGHVLEGSTTRADALYRLQLYQCQTCGHVQKALNQDWHAAMDGLYERHYDDYRIIGRQVNFVDGKIVSRDGLAVRNLESLLSLGERGAVLDIGCGAGRFLQAFGEEKPGWDLAGYDVGDLHKESIRAIMGADFYFGENGLKDIPGKFDLITLNHVVEHLTDPVSVLKEAAALLAPGGHLVVRVPCFLGVHTDFFLMEHCSHFTFETLTNALALAGLKVTREIENLSAIEIGVAAVKVPEKAYTPAYALEAIESEARRCLAWAESLPKLIRAEANNRKVGVFGVGGAGLWLGVYMRGEISFYVDEDVGKQGHNFAGCPILSGKQIPEGAVVFVTFNNAQASQRICARLSAAYPSMTFVSPPEVAVARSSQAMEHNGRVAFAAGG